MAEKIRTDAYRTGILDVERSLDLSEPRPDSKEAKKLTRAVEGLSAASGR